MNERERNTRNWTCSYTLFFLRSRLFFAFQLLDCPHIAFKNKINEGLEEYGHRSKPREVSLNLSHLLLEITAAFRIN
jgi:hypothetical protein